MRLRRIALLPVLLALSTLHVSPLLAGPASVPTGFADALVASSLDLPVGLAEVPDPTIDTARRVLFVEQVTGRVGLIVGNSVSTVGTVPGLDTGGGEQGLLGITVDPGFPARPYVYIHCDDARPGHLNTISISRFTVTGDLAYTGNGRFTFDAATRYDVLVGLPDNASNHNGGTVRFAPDGMLYVSLGDDAAGCPAQDITQLVGKILRLDVSQLPAGAGGPPPIALIAAAGNPYANDADSSARLVWTDGLRNPFRFQVDPITGALVIADVGQGAWEELDLAASGGLDMGWPLREGPAAYTTCSLTPPAPFTEPIAYYDHSTGDAIVAGPLYRRMSAGQYDFPAEYAGDIFFLDYYDGQLRRIEGSGSSWSTAPAVDGQVDPNFWGTGFDAVSDLIELADGSLVYCRQYTSGAGTGEVRRIVYTGSAGVTPPVVSGVELSAPRPNPSRGSATVAWSQASASPVRVAIYSLDGARVRTLVDREPFGAGAHARVWDGRSDAGTAARSGLYLVRLEIAGETRSARMMLVR